MSRKRLIQFKRGAKDDLPTDLKNGEPAWADDTQELYVGDGEGGAHLVGRASKTSTRIRIGGAVLSTTMLGGTGNNRYIIPTALPVGATYIARFINYSIFDNQTNEPIVAGIVFDERDPDTGTCIATANFSHPAGRTRLQYVIELDFSFG